MSRLSSLAVAVLCALVVAPVYAQTNVFTTGTGKLIVHPDANTTFVWGANTTFSVSVLLDIDPSDTDPPPTFLDIIAKPPGGIPGLQGLPMDFTISTRHTFMGDRTWVISSEAFVILKDGLNNTAGPGCLPADEIGTLATAIVWERLGSSFHPISINVAYKYSCKGNGQLVGSGSLTYTDAHLAGYLPYAGPATGSGGGGGGGTGGTPAPAPTTPVVTFPDGFFDQPVGLGNAQSVAVPVSVFVPDGFSSDVTLSASSAPEGLDLTFDNSFLPAPGSGDAILTISAGPDTFPIDRQVAVTATFNDANGNPVSSTSTFTVSLDCNSPMILGVDQPKNASVTRGDTAQVTVKPTGSGPFHYQWFAGSSGQVHFPVSGGTGATLTTAAVNGETPYWVRISNACGSVDSNTVVVSPK